MSEPQNEPSRDESFLSAVRENNGAQVAEDCRHLLRRTQSGKRTSYMNVLSTALSGSRAIQKIDEDFLLRRFNSNPSLRYRDGRSRSDSLKHQEKEPTQNNDRS
ncbi:MAG: hypothetical protein WCG83_05565 [Candidatus Peregrinibacteria bacterium]